MVSIWYPVLTASFTAQRADFLLQDGMVPAPPWTIMQGLNGRFVSAIKAEKNCTSNPENAWNQNKHRRLARARVLPDTTQRSYPQFFDLFENFKMAENGLQVSEQQIERFFEVAVSVARKAGEVITKRDKCSFSIFFYLVKQIVKSVNLNCFFDCVLSNVYVS